MRAVRAQDKRVRSIRQRAQEDTHDVALDVFLAEPAPLERINGEDESLDQNTTFQGDAVQVDRLGRIMN